MNAAHKKFILGIGYHEFWEKQVGDRDRHPEEEAAEVWVNVLLRKDINMSINYKKICTFTHILLLYIL